MSLLDEWRQVHAQMVATAEQFGRLLAQAESKAAAKATGAPTQVEYDRERLSTAPVPVQPAPRVQSTPADGDGTFINFTANTLEVGFDKGSKTFKVKGGKWQKFGVRVWPEVLTEEFGWNPDELSPGEYEFHNNVRVQMDGEKPRKVVGLAQ